MNTTREAIRDALTGTQDPLSVAEICAATGTQPLAVNRELTAMQQIGEVERVWPYDQSWWWLTADSTLRALDFEAGPR